MGRPKIVPDEVLLSALDTFWIEECNGVPAKLGPKSFSDYLQRSGYPVSDSVLRHNKNVTAKISSLKAQAKKGSPPPALSTKETSGSTGTSNRNADIVEKYQLMQKFLSETYVKGIYIHLVNRELSLSLDTPVQPEAVERDLVTAQMNPFTSPAVENLAKLFDFEDDEEDEKPLP